MDEKTIKTLIVSAMEARKNSYCPYSGFRVGAALLTGSGRIYTAVNVENSSYPAGICAEQAAFARAVSEGERSFIAVAVIGGKEAPESRSFSAECYPCGICRQFMYELGGGDLEIITAESEDKYSVIKLCRLLPYSFTLDSSEGK